MSTVLLVEDDDNTRERLAGIISVTPGLSLLGAANNIAVARGYLQHQKPDVLLTDLKLPDGNGVELIRQVRGQNETTEVLVISVFGDERNVMAALQAGAAGYILKDGTTEHIGNAILELIDGGSPISPRIARYLLNRLSAVQDTASTTEPIQENKSLLTEREIDVLQAVNKGYTYGEIAKTMEISFHTVSSHVKNIYRKLEVHSRSEAVYEAVNLGLISMAS